tara:strand:+ start:215 stop:478 length:264 start_codon:yes stop_codon:yes gene_type:complete
MTIKKFRKKTVKITKKYNTFLVDSFLIKYPELAGGRKNYLKKEINIVKTMCLTNVFTIGKKLKAHYIGSINFKKEKQKITLTAKIFY